MAIEIKLASRIEKTDARHLTGLESLLAFDPQEGRFVPPFRIFDLDEPGVTIQTVPEVYGSVIQNLRLIKRPGTNVWSRQDRYGRTLTYV